MRNHSACLMTSYPVSVLANFWSGPNAPTAVITAQTDQPTRIPIRILVEIRPKSVLHIWIFSFLIFKHNISIFHVNLAKEEWMVNKIPITFSLDLFTSSKLSFSNEKTYIL